MRTKFMTILAAAFAAFSAAAEFAYKAEITVSGYSGATTLANFPVLVRLSPARIDGFRYTRCQSDGKDIQFTSLDGETVYPHEVDEWNADGESLVWVNLPSLSGTGTKFLFWFGDASITAAPESKTTWANACGGFYAGVWHLGETATAETAMDVKNADSAKHGTTAQNMDLTPLAMKPAGGTEEKVSVEGVVGTGRQNGLTTGSAVTGNGLRAGYRPSSFSDFTKGQFTFSTWIKINAYSIWTVLAGTKTESSRTGWWLQINSAKVLSFYGDYIEGHTLKGLAVTMPNDMTQEGWFHLTVTVNQKQVALYHNAELVDEAELSDAPSVDASLFALGNGPYRAAASYDEARILSSVASTDWIKAEYETASVESYLTYGAAQKLVEDSFVITAEPEQIGTVSPAYGTITELDEPILCTASDDDVVISSDLRISYRGWTLYRADDDGIFQEIDSAATNQLLYVHKSGTIDKLVWHFVRKRPLTLTASPNVGGSFTVGGVAAASGTHWLEEQASLTVATVANDGYDFLWWGGSHLGEQTTTQTIPFDTGAAVSLESVFVSNGKGHDPVTVGTKGASGSWMDAANWSGGSVPQYGDTVFVTNGSLTLDQPLPWHAKLVVSNATLTVSNWMTRVYADDIVVGPKGVVRLVGGFYDSDMSNRLWLVGKTLRIEKGGSITADNAGYACNSGPCWAAIKAAGKTISRDAAGVYGGACTQPSSSMPSPYGSAEEPSDPGSGCGELQANLKRTVGVGGGAIRMDFSGDVVVDGSVSASVAQGSTPGSGAMYGSGGGIWISCRTIAGAGSVAADGGPSTYDGNQAGGGGGRVAVHYDTTAQDAVDCAVSFSARGVVAVDQIAGKTVVPGETLLFNDYVRSGEDHSFAMEPGTIWFSDNRFLSSPTYLANKMPLSGRWVSPVPLTTLDWPGSLQITNSFLQLPAGVTVTVNGDLSVGGSGYYARRNNGLVFSNSTVRVKGNLEIVGARVELRGGSLTVDGDVTEVATPGTSVKHAASRFRGGEVALKPGLADADGCGATLSIAGTWRIPDLCYACPFADPLTGAWVKMNAGNVVLDAGGRIDADEKGWRATKGPGVPSSYERGATHAGTGGTNAKVPPVIPAVYGNAKKPVELGSGGGSAHTHAGFDGGGLVFLEVDDTFTLNGTVSADGNTRLTARYAGGSSGGSVYIRARRLAGTTGQLRAQGGFAPPAANGCAAYGSTGGGGRIAVWTAVNDWTDEMRANNATVASGAEAGALSNTFGATAGTVVWKQIGGLLLILR